MKFLSLIFILALVSLGYGQRIHNVQYRHKLELKKRFALLNLSNEQKNQIRATITETKLAIKPVKTDIKLKRVQLDNEMRAEQPDQAKIMALTKEISDLQLKIRQAKVDGKLKILSALTPVQEEQLNLPFTK